MLDVAYETIPDEEVTEWTNECGEAERIRKDAIKETDTAKESSHSQFPANPIETEETVRLLHYLQKKKLLRQNQKLQIMQNLQ